MTLLHHVDEPLPGAGSHREGWRVARVDEEERLDALVGELVDLGVRVLPRVRAVGVQLLAGVVEQLLIDTKRARDSDVAAMNMQLVNWRDGRAANEAFVAGSGDALRTWRQP